jgi:glutamine amidotransferase
MALNALSGVALSKPIGGLRALDAFRQRSSENPDGWGMALWEGRGVRIFKEPVSALKSALYGNLSAMESLVSPVWLVHVRETSVGGNTADNTHPFSREWMGRDYAFAHNGTLKDYPKDSAGPRFHPAGDTDSEWACCRLMDAMAAAFPGIRPGESFMDLEGAPPVFARACREIDEWGRFNLLFSDGKHLWVYRDAEGYKGLSWRPTEAGALIASTALDKEKWISLEPGRLTLFVDGLESGSLGIR